MSTNLSRRIAVLLSCGTTAIVGAGAGILDAMGGQRDGGGEREERRARHRISQQKTPRGPEPARRHLYAARRQNVNFTPKRATIGAWKPLSFPNCGFSVIRLAATAFAIRSSKLSCPA